MSATSPSGYRTQHPVPELHEAQFRGRYQQGHHHGRDTTKGYLVVRTDWSDGLAALKREPLAFFEIEPEFRSGEAKWTNAYTEALAKVAEVRAEAGECQFGVIDTIYDCGCRFYG